MYHRRQPANVCRRDPLLLKRFFHHILPCQIGEDLEGLSRRRPSSQGERFPS
jgi:hypothetical protein